MHIRAGMIFPSEHVRAGMIAPMCAHTRRNDRAYVARGLVGRGILRAIKTRPSVDQLERHDSVYANTCASIRHDSVYANTCASMFMRHSGHLFGTKEGT